MTDFDKSMASIERSIDKMADNAARRLLKMDGVNPGIIERVVQEEFDGMPPMSPSAHDRTIARMRQIYREERQCTRTGSR